MDEAASKFSSKSPQEECFACSYIQKENGDVIGNVYCADDPDKLENGNVKCPMYANAACYTGTSAHYVSKCQYFQFSILFENFDILAKWK